MSIATDPIISNVFFTLSLIPHFRQPITGQVCENIGHNLPCISVLLALFREKKEDIETTLTSLKGQTFPRSKLEVILSVPLYWIFVSACAMSALFQSTNRWYKTER